MSKLSIQTSNVRFPIAPDLYGLFFEDINRAGDSGLYPEMLRNRSFEDSIPPERCIVSEDKVKFTTPLGWSDQFNNGEGLTRWMEGSPETPIPAWYTENAEISLDYADTLNNKRLASLRISFRRGGALKNLGFRGMAFKQGASYPFYMFAKSIGQAVTLQAAIVGEDGTVLDQKDIVAQPGGFRRYDCTFTAAKADNNGFMRLLAPEAGEILIGFTSLMPADTFKGHGMRKDLMELLDGINAHFLRFPGGCIVEGFTKETAMRFSNTIGPVWERPSHLLMWHYRTTNGLGFHEYLQICEDLGLEPMYVANCGMTCQGRAMELFEGEELMEFLQETFDSIEYAIGCADTPMGKKRAEAGHPEPFKLSYIEIGNENHGPEYNMRYKLFYDALKARYPDIKYISNTHTEEDGLPTEIADEHFYNTSNFFTENTHYYDNYDRNGPKIFVGEYAANSGEDSGTLRGALAEAMFLMGIEHNQDIVTLTAYAPLFENMNYSSWFPNLIRYDNYRSLGIPSYHVQSVLGKNRGKDVVASRVEAETLYRKISGLPAIISAKGGMRFKDAAINGSPSAISNLLQGDMSEQDGVFTMREDPTIPAINRPERATLHKRTGASFGGDAISTGTFEVTAMSDKDNPISIAVWCHYPFSVFKLDETAEEKFDLRSIRYCFWNMDGTTSSISESYWFGNVPLGQDVPVAVNLGEYNTYKVVMKEDGFDCYLNGKLVHAAPLPPYPAMSAVVTTDDDRVIVKIVNITNVEDTLEIALDCDVAPDYEVELLTGSSPGAMNTPENPNAVSAVTKKMTGASSVFSYKAPAYSLNVLCLKRR